MRKACIHACYKTWHYSILKDIFNLDFHGNLPIFIKKKKKNLRCFQVCIGFTFSNFYLQEEGVPQGNVLSVTLFSLKITDILNQLPPTVHSNPYVEGLSIFSQGKDMRYIERQLQLDMEHIIAWTNEMALFFQLTKYIVCTFVMYVVFIMTQRFFINKRQISVLDTACFLGIFFDKKITFPHI